MANFFYQVLKRGVSQMTRVMTQTFLLFFALAWTSVAHAAQYEGDNAEFKAAQAAEARAYQSYYQKLKTTPASDRAKLKSILTDSDQKMDQLLRSRRAKEDAQTSGRAYFSDGRVMDLSKYDPNQDPNALAPNDAEPGESHDSPAGAVSSGSTAPGPASLSTGSDGGSKGPNGRPQFILDGSNIPKELNFKKPSQ